jgi:hypothetical protein
LKLKAVVDRIEGDVAVLLVGPEEMSVDFPLSCLPEVREGSILDVVIEEDQGTENERRIRAQELLEKLIRKNK